MSMTVTIVGDEKLTKKFAEVYPTLEGLLEKATARAALRLLRHVKEDKLNGQVLNVRTGRLRRSITMRVETEGSTVTGFVGTNVAYAARFEYGFSGTETVRSFMRKTPSGGTANVRSFTRKVNVPARSFLGSAYDDQRDAIQAELRTAATQTVRELFGGGA